MLCICFSLLQCVVLSPSQSLNLKALMRTLDKSKVSSIQGVAGGETLVVFLIACVWNARSRSRRAWPSASSSTGGGRGTRARAGLRRPHGIRLWRPHGFRLRRPRGTLDMLHRNEEHTLKSLHAD
jgi:hypothetical protein